MHLENFTSTLYRWFDHILFVLEWFFIFIGLVIYTIGLFALIVLDWLLG